MSIVASIGIIILAIIFILRYDSLFVPDNSGIMQQHQRAFSQYASGLMPSQHEQPIETFFTIPTQKLYQKSRLGQLQTIEQIKQRERAFQTFREWLVENGGELHENVTFGFVRKDNLLHSGVADQSIRESILREEDFVNQMGIGLMTREGTMGMERQSISLKVPQSLFINHQTIMMLNPKLAEAFRDVYQTYTLIVKHEIMFFLLHEKLVSGENSYYKPYLDVLPQSFPNCPIFWTAVELKVFHGSTLYDRVIIAREAFKQTYQLFMQNIFLPHPEIVPVEKMCFDDFLWAEWIFQSRAFFLDGRSPREVIVPGADFVNNHDKKAAAPSGIVHQDRTTAGGSPPSVTNSAFNMMKIGSLNTMGNSISADDDDNGVMLSVDYDYGPNEQIYETVTNFKSNDDLLRFDGFIFEENPNDCVWVFIPFPEEKKELVHQHFGFQEHAMPQFCFSAKDVQANLWPHNALPYMRAIMSLYDSLDTPHEHPVNFNRMVSLANEEACMQQLVQIVQQLVELNPYSEEKFPREELDNMYKMGKLNHRMWLGIRFRIFERKKHIQLLNLFYQRLETLKTVPDMQAELEHIKAELSKAQLNNNAGRMSELEQSFRGLRDTIQVLQNGGVV